MLYGIIQFIAIAENPRKWVGKKEEKRKKNQQQCVLVYSEVLVSLMFCWERIINISEHIHS